MSDTTTGAATAAPQRVETQVWEPDTTPGREGYLRLVRTKTIREVYDELRAIVGEYPDGGEEYLSVIMSRDALREWPNAIGGRIAVFAVNGSSEGDYVHVEVHTGDGRRECVLLAKTFMGRDAAWRFARRVADLLEA